LHHGTTPDQVAIVDADLVLHSVKQRAPPEC